MLDNNWRHPSNNARFVKTVAVHFVAYLYLVVLEEKCKVREITSYLCLPSLLPRTTKVSDNGCRAIGANNGRCSCSGIIFRRLRHCDT